MIVKNISGETRFFGFGRATSVRGRSLIDQATYTIPDNDPIALASVQAYVAQGVMSIVEGPSQNTLLASANLPAAGFILVNGATSNTTYTVTVAGQVFQFAADPGSAVLGEHNSNLSALANVWAGAGAAAATAAGTLRTAINALSDDLNVVAGTPVQYSSGKYVIPLHAKDGTVTYTGLTLAKAGTNLDVSANTFGSGTQGPGRKTQFIKRAVVAADVTLGAIVVSTGLASVSNYLVQVRAATGAAVGWTGTVTINGGDITLANTGGTDFADTQVITIFAQE